MPKKRTPFPSKILNILAKESKIKDSADLRRAVLIAREKGLIDDKILAQFLVWMRRSGNPSFAYLAWKIIKANDGKIPKSLEEIMKLREKVRTTRGGILSEMTLLNVAYKVFGIKEAAGKGWEKSYKEYEKIIEKALGRRPKTVEEVFEGARRAGLKISEWTLLQVAYEVFGIKEAIAKGWEKSLREYGERIERALGRRPRSVEEVFEGAKRAGLKISEGTLLQVAYEVFGIKEAVRKMWGKKALKKYPRKEDVVKEIKKRYNKGKLLAPREVQKEDQYLYNAAIYYFGSYRNAIDAIFGKGFYKYVVKSLPQPKKEVKIEKAIMKKIEERGEEVSGETVMREREKIIYNVLKHEMKMEDWEIRDIARIVRKVPIDVFLESFKFLRNELRKRGIDDEKMKTWFYKRPELLQTNVEKLKANLEILDDFGVNIASLSDPRVLAASVRTLKENLLWLLDHGEEWIKKFVEGAWKSPKEFQNWVYRHFR